MQKQKIMCIGWPAFLAAATLEMLVFAVVDPGEMHWLGQAAPLSRQGVYTLAFFAFWVVTAASGALTVMLAER